MPCRDMASPQSSFHKGVAPYVNVDLVVHVFVMIKPCSSQFYLLHHFVSPSDNAESTEFISKLTSNDFIQLIGYDQFMMNHTYQTS
jgi:hypothetical protein